MGNRIVFPKLDFAKPTSALSRAGNVALCFVNNNKEAILTGAAVTVAADNLRIRHARRKEKKEFEKSAIQQKQIVRKHEAEINVLKAEADSAREAINRVDQLERIISQITEGDEDT